MRRTFLLLLALVCSVLTIVATPQAAQAIAAPRGLKVEGARAFESLVVGWKWASAPKSYALQIAENRKFRKADKVKVGAKASRPPGGRQTYRFKGLTDGTRYFVRVAAISESGKRSGWSSTLKAATRIRYPSPLDGDSLKVVSGPGPGEVTFSWKTAGKYTDYFRIDTATSPFDGGARDHMFFKVDPGLRRYTLSADQTEAAGAGIGVAWTLVWRFEAVNTGTAGTEDRYFGHGQARVPGAPASGAGSQIRVASYNIRTEANVAQEHPGRPELLWDKRAPRIVDMIKTHGPGIVLVQELFPGMVDLFETTLAENGMGRYALNRSTRLKTGADGEHPLQNRILYDTHRYAMVSNCPDSVDSTACHIAFPADLDDGPDYAPYVRMRDLKTGQEFLVLSFHLPNERPGDPVMEALRVRSMSSIMTRLEEVAPPGLPIILGGDSNSSQLRLGERPHDVLMEHGFYDTASAVTHVNPEYGTFNDFAYQEPSAFGISPRIDLVATRGMPGSDKFVNVVIRPGEDFPSDHDMVYADLRLPLP